MVSFKLGDAERKCYGRRHKHSLIEEFGEPPSGTCGMTAPNSLIAELEDTFNHGSREKRVECLRRITDLFLTSANGLDNDQVAVFDDVLCYLVKAIEARALVELSKRLAPIGNAPVEVIRRLARNDDVAVAEPVLTQSPRLGNDDLIEIAKSK